MNNEKLIYVTYTLTVILISVCTMLLATVIDQSKIEIIQEIHKLK